MVKPEWGTRHICYKCGAKFYDLKKEPVLCPKCGADQAKAPVKSSSAPVRKPRPAAVDEEAEDTTIGDEFEDIDEVGLDEIEEDTPDEEEV